MHSENALFVILSLILYLDQDNLWILMIWKETSTVFVKKLFSPFHRMWDDFDDDLLNNFSFSYFFDFFFEKYVFHLWKYK